MESLEESVNDLLPLFVRYYKEVAATVEYAPALDPDWSSLLREAAFDRVLFVTARHGGVMMGFALNVLYAHWLHRSVPHAQTHEYVDPAYRDGIFAVKFLKRNIELLRQKGVKRAYIATGNARLGAVYERIGYHFLEAAYVADL